jgi:aminopeptidase YwaD
MTGSPDGEVRGRVVFIGLGRPSEVEGRDLDGAIALVNRGVITFRDKALAAQQAGAVGLIVANNGPGPARGTIDASAGVRIPVVGVTPEDAEPIDIAEEEGTVLTLRAQRTSQPFESRNVVARPDGDEACTAYVGGHFDSVARAPGANDNASGTAGVLELARTHRARGLCYAAFGAEELGLFGSKALIKEHGVRGVRFMLNLDMLGVLAGPEVVSVGSDQRSRSMAERASSAAAAIGITIPTGTFPPFASSDHASFTEAGVPAVTLHSGDDPVMHSPDDDFEHIEQQSIATMLRAASAILRDQLGSN